MHSRIALAAVFAASVLATGCQQQGSAGNRPAPSTDDEKLFYALGYELGSKVKAVDGGPEVVDHVAKGIEDSLSEAEPAVDLKEWRRKLNEKRFAKRREAMEAQRAEQSQAAEGNKKEGAAFAAKVAEEKNARTLDSGVVYVQLQAGKGKSPTADDKVTVHYTGKLIDGTVFDSSVQRGKPATFPLKGVVKCWTEGVQQMKVGGKARLICPSDTAYQDRGRPPTIPPGATLDFEVELIEIAS